MDKKSIFFSSTLVLCIFLIPFTLSTVSRDLGTYSSCSTLELVAAIHTPTNDELSIAIRGNYAYLGSDDNNGYITIFDISDPYNPVQVGTTGKTGQEMFRLRTYGNSLYAANDANGLVIYDISNPISPTKLGSRKDGQYASSVYVNEHTYPYVYVTYLYTTGKELAIYDVSDPSLISLVAQYDASGSMHGYDVCVRDGLAYISSGHEPNALDIVDVSNLASPRKVGYWNTGRQPASGGLVVNGHYAYLAVPEDVEERGVPGGLRILDGSDPTSPILAGSYSLLGNHWKHAAQWIDVVDHYAYVVTSHNPYVTTTPGTKDALWMFDVSDPSDPVLVDFLDLGALGTGAPTAVKVEGNFAYLASSDFRGVAPDPHGLQIVKVTTPTPPVITATTDIHPQALNLRSKGKCITAYVELPESYDVNDINVSTVMLNDTILAELHPTEVGDYDNDGVLDLMVKFSKAEVIAYVLTNIDSSKLEGLSRPYVMEATLAVTGRLYDNTSFVGYDTVYVIFGYVPIP